MASELEMYGNVSNSDRLQLQAIIEQVAEDARGAGGTAGTCSHTLPPEHRPPWATAGLPEHFATPEDSVRVCGRSDANMRELLQLVRGLDDAARNVEEHLNHQPAWGRDDMTSRAQPQLPRDTSEVTTVHPNDVSTKVEPIKMQDLTMEVSPPEARLQATGSPEPEPHPFVDSFQAKEAAEYLKDRMNSSSVAQGSRLHALEVAIDTLAQRIKPMLTTGSSIDPQRFDALEAKVQQLSETLAPILRADSEIADMSPAFLRPWYGNLGSGPVL